MLIRGKCLMVPHDYFYVEVELSNLKTLVEYLGDKIVGINTNSNVEAIDENLCEDEDYVNSIETTDGEPLTLKAITVKVKTDVYPDTDPNSAVPHNADNPMSTFLALSNLLNKKEEDKNIKKGTILVFRKLHNGSYDLISIYDNINDFYNATEDFIICE